MKKSTKIILVSTLSVLLLVILAGVLFIFDALPAGIATAIQRMIAGGNQPVTHQQEEGVNDVFTPRSLPTDMHGVWLDINTDIKTSPQDSYGALVTETGAYFNNFKNVKGDTVFLTPDLTGQFASMRDAYGTSVDMLWQMIGSADLSDYYKVLVVPDALLYDKKGNLTFEQINTYLSIYTFHAVLLDSDRMRSQGDCAAAAELIGTQMEASFPDRYLGMAFSSEGQEPYAGNDALSALQSGHVRFCVVDAGGAIRSSPSFKTVIYWWNTLAKQNPAVRFYCRHHNDLVLTGGSWNDHLEICEQVRVLWNCENFSGSVFQGASALMANVKSSTQRLAYLFDEGIPEDLKIKSMSVDAASAQVHITGAASSSYKLICNREVLSDGASSFDRNFSLAAGDSTLSLFNAGRRFTYRIFRNTPDVAPARAQSETDAVTPFTDHGLGTTVMCRIVEENTETLGRPNEKDTYHADYSTLYPGTLDYFTSATVSDDGKLRYELQSGNAVFAVNCELIVGAYTLPQNHLAVAGVDDSDPTRTDILLQTDWFVPVNLSCLPQTYFKGYRDYNFNIASFSATYVDVRFSHTAGISGTELLTFAANAPFYATEVLQEEDAVILRLHLRKPGQFYGYHVERNEAGQMVLSFKKHADGSLTGKTVMLDPGHGGLSMTGTALNDNSIAEKIVTLSIANKAKQMLESYGATVLMTRYMDTPLSLEERCAILQHENPDVFVSIHCDGADNKSESGTHTFYFRPYSMPLADAIHQSMVASYRTNIYKPTDTNYANIDKKIKYYPFFVTRMDNCPSVLCETGFMSNQVEGQILANDNYQYWMAQGIADGIRNYFLMNY